VHRFRLAVRVVGLQAERTSSPTTSASGNAMFVIAATAWWWGFRFPQSWHMQVTIFCMNTLSSRD
jgi:hypothetical protein